MQLTDMQAQVLAGILQGKTRSGQLQEWLHITKMGVWLQLSDLANDPFNLIAMRHDAVGFYYVVIDETAARAAIKAKREELANWHLDIQAKLRVHYRKK